MNSTTDVHEGAIEIYFGWLDYSFFILMLVLSALIGVYFGFWGKKEDSPEEYLLGGKSMSTLPVAMSLVASLVSGITVMGDPSEIYSYGTLYWVSIYGAPFVGIINNYFYLPVFYELQITSVYEYLQLRFNRRVRIMASFLGTIGLLLYVPLVLYVPALALSQVSGMNLYIVTPIIAVVCIFYTMLGGIKAVVWTDFLQGVVMVVASIAVIILGLVHVGGFSTVWERSVAGGRIKLYDSNLDIFERMTFWGVIVGGASGWTAMLTVNQAMVQRFLSLSTYAKAQKSLVFLVVGILIIKCISCYMGLLIYATYYDCDPLKTKVITRSDQLLAYYVMDIAGSLPGLPGLFVAGIFSAALSTMSSSLNSLGATLFEDFVRPCLNIKVSDKTSSNIIKLIVIGIGIVCVLIVFIVDKIGGILQLAMSTAGVTLGPMFGLFTFGMFYPRGNSEGALVGSVASLLAMGWIVFGNQKALAEGNLKYEKLSTTAEGCGFNDTISSPVPTEFPEKEVFVLFRVSFLYYTIMGFVVMFVIGIIVSLLTKPPNIEEMNPTLFSPVIRKYVEKKKKKHEMKIIDGGKIMYMAPSE